MILGSPKDFRTPHLKKNKDGFDAGIFDSKILPWKILRRYRFSGTVRICKGRGSQCSNVHGSPSGSDKPFFGSKTGDQPMSAAVNYDSYLFSKRMWIFFLITVTIGSHRIPEMGSRVSIQTIPIMWRCYWDLSP